MKQFLTILFFPCVFLLQCKGQEPKKENERTSKYVSFTEKQGNSSDIIKDETRDNSMAITSFRYAAKKATPGVVHVKSFYPVGTGKSDFDLFRDFFGDDFFREFYPPGERSKKISIGSASGVLVSDDGYIVTNNHVVDRAESLEVILHDKRAYKASVIGTDRLTDLALIKIEEQHLPFIHFGNSDSVQVGDFVLAVGNPFNLESTVTAGIISAKARNISMLNDQGAIESYLQTDAAVNQGNSGGALVDINGRLVGINSAIASPTGAYAGYSFAVPTEIVRKVIDDLLNYKMVMRGYMGIVVSDLDGERARALGIPNTLGVMVDSIQPGGAAKEAGVKKGDIIIMINGYQTETTPQLREIIARHKPGDRLTLTVVRNGRETKIPVVLKSEVPKTTVISVHPAILEKLGIQIENLTPEEKTNYGLRYGVRVVKISKGIISKETKMREGFIIIKVNNKTVNSIEEFLSEIQKTSGGVMVEGIYPGSSQLYFYGFGIN